jgi:hypothetical protein
MRFPPAHHRVIRFARLPPTPPPHSWDIRRCSAPASLRSSCCCAPPDRAQPLRAPPHPALDSHTPAATPAAQPRITPLTRPHRPPPPPRHAHATPATAAPCPPAVSAAAGTARAAPTLLVAASPVRLSRRCGGGGGGGDVASPPPPHPPAGAASHPCFVHRHACTQHRVQALPWPRTLAHPHPTATVLDATARRFPHRCHTRRAHTLSHLPPPTPPDSRHQLISTARVAR